LRAVTTYTEVAGASIGPALISAGNLGGGMTASEYLKLQLGRR